MKLYHDVCNVCLCQCSRKCNDTSATCSKNMYKGKAQTIMQLYDHAKSNMTMKDNIKSCNERWMLHGNVSRNGYGNAIIGRYGGCFEEDIMRLMMRECHAKDLDAPAKFAPTLNVIKGNARYRRG